MTFLKTIHSYAHLSYKLAQVLQWEAPVFSLVAKPPIQSSEFIAFNYLVFTSDCYLQSTK